jgi:hypothetical protein
MIKSFDQEGECWIDLKLGQRDQILMTDYYVIGPWSGVTYQIQWPSPNLHMPINKELTTNYMFKGINNGSS